MQQLVERDTSTPTDIPHVRSHCDPALKVLGGRDGVPGLKTSSNNSDAALTAREQAGQNLRVSVVYVLNQRGQPLMPCSPRTARILLKKGQAHVVKRTPFVIQLDYPTGENKQPITLGVDSGYKNVGLSAISAQAELYAAEVTLRSDEVKLNAERRQYRRSRRNRKTWYRPPRFLNRKKPSGWLAPSLQHKLDNHLKLIQAVSALLPLAEIVVEVAAFDIQKLKNPDIAGIEYQQGEQMGFWNIREYVLHRDHHTCQHCRGLSQDPILNVHHLQSRQTGGDRPANLLTLCRSCHQAYHQGEIQLKAKPAKGFRAETFMTVIRWKLVEALKARFVQVEPTYGYITKHQRIEHQLEKSHLNDAFVIAGGTTQPRAIRWDIKQVRRSNRKLHKGARSHIRNTAPRYIHGFQRYDKVQWNGREAFIFGRRTTGYFDIRTLHGEILHRSVKAKELQLLERAGPFLTERGAFPPPSR